MKHNCQCGARYSCDGACSLPIIATGPCCGQVPEHDEPRAVPATIKLATKSQPRPADKPAIQVDLWDGAA